MTKYLFMTMLFMASVHGEREEVTPKDVPAAASKNYQVRRMDIYQPNFNQMHRYRDVRSPAVEVMMHLPQPFKDVESFKKFLGLKPERIKRHSEEKIKIRGSRSKRNAVQKSIADIRSYDFSLEVPKESTQRVAHRREKREAEIPDSQTAESRSLKIENDPTLEPASFMQTSMGGAYQDKLTAPYPETIIEMPEPIRGPVYTSYNGNMDMESDIGDLDDPRKRTGRTTSASDHDDGNSRDKRTYMDNGGENRESTTAPPFWKRKKENPPFVTGRDGKTRDNKVNNYTPPQHRSGDNNRESHSMKDLDKSVQSNEIPRSPQDSYYASTNRRAYNSRQAENFTPSTPKSVYDTIDYSNSRRSQEGRNQFGRNYDAKETFDRSRPTYEQLAKQYAYPKVYDRYYYPYPYPGEVAGRGIEYYHRTYDPATGRIIYYANMPDQRSYDLNPRPIDPTGRSFYANGRTYVYDPYGRSYILPYDYRLYDAYGRPLDYLRNGRSNAAEAYSNNYHGGEKLTRDARYEGRYEKGDRYRDDIRNKTYVIFDAEENRPTYPRNPYLQDVNRYGYPAPPNVPPTQVPYRSYPLPSPPAYPVSYPSRNQYYPVAPPAPWGTNPRPLVGVTDPSYTPRPYNSPDVQLPLSTSSRSLPPPGSYDKLKKI